MSELDELTNVIRLEAEHCCPLLDWRCFVVPISEIKDRVPHILLGAHLLINNQRFKVACEIDSQMRKELVIDLVAEEVRKMLWSLGPAVMNWRPMGESILNYAPQEQS